MAQVTLTGVSKRFGATPAVDRVDLTIHDGELMAGLGQMALPLFLAFMFLNRYFIQGLSAGAMKQ